MVYSSLSFIEENKSKHISLVAKTNDPRSFSILDVSALSKSKQLKSSVPATVQIRASFKAFLHVLFNNTISLASFQIHSSVVKSSSGVVIATDRLYKTFRLYINRISMSIEYAKIDHFTDPTLFPTSSPSDHTQDSGQQTSL